MTDQTDNHDPELLHDRQAIAVMTAVAKLLPNLAAKEFTPEAIFEGAVKGAAAMMLSATPATADDVAQLLEEIAGEFRNLDKPHLHVVQ